jgi:hypothetical protein
MGHIKELSFAPAAPELGPTSLISILGFFKAGDLGGLIDPP